MVSKHLFTASALSLAAAVALLTAGPALAQHWGGHHGGYHHGGNYPGHYGGYSHRYGYHPGYYHHYGYYPGYYHYGLGYYPRYYGYSWYPPGYYSPGYYLDRPIPSGYQAYYPPAAGAPAGIDQVVHFDIRVPADAKIWFDGEKTTQTGPAREFVSPPLAPGREYTYEVRVQWTENGREVTQNRRVTVRAGERVRITFPETSDKIK